MFCKAAKEYLSQRGIPFVEKDVAANKAALKELQRLGYMTTPVIKINGEVVVGFDRRRLDSLLPRKE